MLHPSYSDLMAVVNSDVELGEEPVVQSRYSIVMATAKRARQIVSGEESYIAGGEKRKPLSLAVDELYSSKIKILSAEEAEKLKIQREEEAERLRIQREEEAEAAKIAEEAAEADGDADSDETEDAGAEDIKAEYEAPETENVSDDEKSDEEAGAE